MTKTRGARQAARSTSALRGAPPNVFPRRPLMHRVIPSLWINHMLCRDWPSTATSGGRKSDVCVTSAAGCKPDPTCSPRRRSSSTVRRKPTAFRLQVGVPHTAPGVELAETTSGPGQRPAPPRRARWRGRFPDTETLSQVATRIISARRDSGLAVNGRSGPGRSQQGNPPPPLGGAHAVTT